MYASAGAWGLLKMAPLIVPRRQFLRGLASLAVCAPAVVRASSLMIVSARFCGSSRVTVPWAVAQEAPALLQREMERRFAEMLFGADDLPEEAENVLLTRPAVVAEVKMTALWEMRTLFGLRGSRPQLLEDLPSEVQVGLLAMFGAGLDGSSGACGEVTSPASALRPI
jgi:hypothetical protein